MKANSRRLFLLAVLLATVFIQEVQLSAAIQLTSDTDVSSPQVICPGDTIIFTCTVEGAYIVKWFVPPIITGNDALALSSPGDVRERPGVLARLVSENAMGDIVSTLQVDVTREIEAIVCSDGQRQKNVTISSSIVAPPPPPQNVHHLIFDSRLFEVATEIIWTNNDKLKLPGNYSLYVNDELEAFAGTNTTHILNVLYNTPYVITIADTNCAETTHSLSHEIIVVGCPIPLPPVHGIIDSYDSVIQGTGISYQCDPGLQPVGTFLSECTLTGEWHPNPANMTCQADCGVPSPPVGVHIQNYCSTLENSEVFYSCDSGYSPTVLMKSTCTAEGTWYPDISALICIVDCGKPGDPLGGVVEVNGSTTEGAVVYFYCSQGLLPEEEINSTCMSNGLWTPDPSQLVCTKYGCDTPTVPVNSEITGYKSPQNEDSDLTVMFRCKDGFQPSEFRTAVCAQNGSWAPNPAELMCRASEGCNSLVVVSALSSIITLILTLTIGISIGGLIGRRLRRNSQHMDQKAKLNSKSRAESQACSKEPQYEDMRLPSTMKTQQEQSDAEYTEVVSDYENFRLSVVSNVSYASTQA